MSVGGPTIGVSLTDESRLELQTRGLTDRNMEQVIAEVQRRIVEGGFRLSGEVRVSDD